MCVSMCVYLLSYLSYWFKQVARVGVCVCVGVCVVQGTYNWISRHAFISVMETLAS